MKRIEDDAYPRLQLSSGRIVDVVGGVLGLHIDDDANDEGVHSGSDDYISLKPYIASPWTVDERRELADFMIERWRNFGRVKA